MKNLNIVKQDNSSAKWGFALSLIFMYSSFVFVLVLLLKVVPENKIVFKEFDLVLPVVTQIIITISDFVIKYFLWLWFLLLLPASFFWIIFTVIYEKKVVSTVVNAVLTSIFLILIITTNAALKVPLYNINKLLSEYTTIKDVLLGNPPVSFKDLKERTTKHESFDFTIEPSKNFYTAGEDIVIRYKLININNDRELVNKIIVPGGNLKCYVYNKKDYRGRSEPEGEYGYDSWRAPDEEDLVWLDYGESLKDEITFSSQDYETGSYEVRLSLAMYGVLENNFINLEFYSDPATIEIEQR